MKDIQIICNVLEIKKKKYPDFQAMTYSPAKMALCHETLQEDNKKWEVMTCKNSIISIHKGYQETMYQNLSYDIYHARNGPISKETFNP